MTATLVSVQPFGLNGAGGGSRILRALLADPPMPVLSVVTATNPPPSVDQWEELHLPLRPHLGPIEGSRLHGWANAVEVLVAPEGSRRLAAALRTRSVAAVHAVSHGPEFWPALRVARALGVPFLLTVHDDLRYLLRTTPLRSVALRRLGRAWRDADRRFVISHAMGREYATRYGARSYEIVTDGLRDDQIGAPRPPTGLRIYFAGLFHRGYTDNLIALRRALEPLAAERPPGSVSLTMRCGSLPADLPPSSAPVEVLEFGPERVVAEDMARADLLYLPLMFDEAYRDMTDFSLSTKLVTYLGSGLPILYHGPPRGAAYELLAENDAAVMATSQDPAELRAVLETALERGARVVENALTLARREFRLDEQRRRFWSAVPGSA